MLVDTSEHLESGIDTLHRSKVGDVKDQRCAVCGGAQALSQVGIEPPAILATIKKVWNNTDLTAHAK
jgi:hypothetical protein